jgi:hypothetical protein
MSKMIWISTLITTILFTIEAIITYNIGKHDNLKMNFTSFKKLFDIPPIKDLLKICINVAIFASLGSLITYGINKL